MSPGVRRDDGLFPGRCRVGELPARDRSHRRAMRGLRGLFPRAKMFGMPRKGEIDYSVDLELDLGDVQPSVAGPKRPQDRINLPRARKRISLFAGQTIAGRWLRKVASSDLEQASFRSSQWLARPRRRKWLRPIIQDQGIEPGDELNKVEMVSNRPTPDCGQRNRGGRAAKYFIMARAASATAACSSPRSPVARIRAIRA